MSVFLVPQKIIAEQPWNVAPVCVGFFLEPKPSALWWKSAKLCVCVCLFFLSTHRLALVASVEVHKPLGLAYCGRRCKPMCSAIYYIVFYILYHILYNLLYFIYILYSSPRHLIPVLSWSHFLQLPGKEYEWVWGREKTRWDHAQGTNVETGWMRMV